MRFRHGIYFRECSNASEKQTMRKRTIVWFWLSNPNSSDRKGDFEWMRYSDFENNYVEEAYQSKKKQIELNDDVINFDSNTQNKKNDNNIQIPVE